MNDQPTTNVHDLAALGHHRALVAARPQVYNAIAAAADGITTTQLCTKLRCKFHPTIVNAIVRGLLQDGQIQAGEGKRYFVVTEGGAA